MQKTLKIIKKSTKFVCLFLFVQNRSIFDLQLKIKFFYFSPFFPTIWMPLALQKKTKQTNFVVFFSLLYNLCAKIIKIKHKIIITKNSSKMAQTQASKNFGSGPPGDSWLHPSGHNHKNLTQNHKIVQKKCKKLY